jgi:hypothetical protein
MVNFEIRCIEKNNRYSKPLKRKVYIKANNEHHAKILFQQNFGREYKIEKKKKEEQIFMATDEQIKKILGK